MNAKAQVFTNEFITWLRRIVKWFREQTPDVNNGGKKNPIFEEGSIFFKNDSGEEIPPFACMIVTGTETVDGITYLICNKPTDADAGEYVFNNQKSVAIGSTGAIQSGPVIYVKTDTDLVDDIVDAAICGPVVDEWFVARGGPFYVAGLDTEMGKDIARVILSQTRYLFRFETTESIPSGNNAETGPTTTIKDLTGTITHSEEGVFVNTDGMIEDGISEFKGLCEWRNGKYYFVQGKCGQTCPTSAEIGLQSPPHATIGQDDYEFTPTATGVTSWSASGLPSGWAIDSGTGVITGPGAPDGVLGPAGPLPVTLTATVPKTGGGTCTIKRKITITILAA